MKYFLSLALLLSLLVSCNSQKAPKLESEDDKSFYALGVMFGKRLADLELSDKEVDLVIHGLRETASGKKPQVEIAKYQMKIQQLFQSRISKKNDAEKENGIKYLEKFLTEEGVKKTDSGLAYKVLKQGTGATPKAEDSVEVHYHGTLIDGTVFDSSVDRGKTVTFPLNRVIRGWTEGLQLIKEGGKVRLVIPSDLAYGDHGAPPKIPGGATLVFDVELFKISKAKPAEKKANSKPKMKK